MSVREALIDVLKSAGFSISEDISDHELVRRAKAMITAFTESDTIPGLISEVTRRLRRDSWISFQS